MLNTARISVRSLVEYVFRSGSIDSGFRTAGTLTEGTRAHKKVQKQYKDCDRKEMQLQALIDYENLMFSIEGRCDGVLFQGEEVTIDEIKSTVSDLSFFTAIF